MDSNDHIFYLSFFQCFIMIMYIPASLVLFVSLLLVNHLYFLMLFHGVIIYDDDDDVNGKH